MQKRVKIRVKNPHCRGKRCGICPVCTYQTARVMQGMTAEDRVAYWASFFNSMNGLYTSKDISILLEDDSHLTKADIRKIIKKCQKE